jgi:hypothetical protein
MSDKISRQARRFARRCDYDYYRLPAWRDHSCLRASQQGRTAGDSTARQCSRDRASPELPLASSEIFFPGWLGVLLANG